MALSSRMARPGPQDKEPELCPKRWVQGLHLALTHPQEVVIHEEEPLKAARVVQDHSGWAKSPFNLPCKGERHGVGQARGSDEIYGVHGTHWESLQCPPGPSFDTPAHPRLSHTLALFILIVYLQQLVQVLWKVLEVQGFPGESERLPGDHKSLKSAG